MTKLENAISYLPVHDGGLQIFDVDHGQCALLTVPALGHTAFRVLIDCGHATRFRSGSWYPGTHLQRLGVHYLDMLVCTNFDEDHMSGYPDLLNRGIGIGCILANPTITPEMIVQLKTRDGMGPGIAALANALAIRRGMAWAQVPPTIPNVNMIWSWNPFPYFDDENNLSLVFTLDIRGFRFMFPGDMESNGWANLLATCPAFRPVVAGVDVLVAAHHGRRSGISKKMFDVYGCNPKLVIISDDCKKYDTQDTTSYYGSKAIGITNYRGQPGVRRVLSTRSDGEICFSFVNDRCYVF